MTAAADTAASGRAIRAGLPLLPDADVRPVVPAGPGWTSAGPVRRSTRSTSSRSPTADTGTNLLPDHGGGRAGAEAARLRGRRPPGWPLARGAMLGARGNSGVIVGPAAARDGGTVQGGRTRPAPESRHAALQRPRISPTSRSPGHGGHRPDASLGPPRPRPQGTISPPSGQKAAAAARARWATPASWQCSRAGVVDAGGRGCWSSTRWRRWSPESTRMTPAPRPTGGRRGDRRAAGRDGRRRLRGHVSAGHRRGGRRALREAGVAR